MQKAPKYTFDIIMRSEAKRKKYFAGLNLIISDLKNVGEYEQAAIIARKKKEVQEMIELLTAA